MAFYRQYADRRAAQPQQAGKRGTAIISISPYWGITETEVASLWKNLNRMFMRPNDLIGNELSRVPVQRGAGCPTAVPSYRRFARRSVEPYAGGKTPMYHALTECYRLCKAWCGAKAHRKSYPPTIFNITDGESSDGDDFKLQEIADSIKGLSTEDGAALLINIHISSDAERSPVLFPESKKSFPISVTPGCCTICPVKCRQSITKASSSCGDATGSVSGGSVTTRR